MRKNEPDDSLHAITYVSRSTLRGDATTIRRETERLFEVSRLRNERDGITGLLMTGRLCFAQILEGPRDDVERTFRRLEIDPRHEDVVVLTREPLRTRSFGRWAMARVDDESGLIDRFFARRAVDATRYPNIALDEPPPPRGFLLEEVEHLAAGTGRASTTHLFTRPPFRPEGGRPDGVVNGADRRASPRGRQDARSTAV